MIDFGKIKANGRLNYQNGMLFYFSGYGRVISFYIETTDESWKVMDKNSDSDAVTVGFNTRNDGKD